MSFLCAVFIFFQESANDDEPIPDENLETMIQQFNQDSQRVQAMVNEFHQASDRLHSSVEAFNKQSQDSAPEDEPILHSMKKSASAPLPDDKIPISGITILMENQLSPIQSLILEVLKTPIDDWTYETTHKFDNKRRELREKLKNSDDQDDILILKQAIELKHEQMVRREEYENGPYSGLKRFVNNPKLSFKGTLQDYNSRQIENLFLNPLKDSPHDVESRHINLGMGLLLFGKRKQLNQTKKSEKTKQNELKEYKQEILDKLKDLGLYLNHQ